jgi:hypothetical protein
MKSSFWQIRKSDAALTSLGFGINGLGNALFLYLISINAPTQVLLEAIVFWSAIFWSGAVVAPFETLFLYSKAKNQSIKSSMSFTLISVSIFTFSGAVVYFSMNLQPSVILLMTFIGLSNLVTVKNRPIKLAEKNFRIVAQANSYEGTIRAALVMLLILLDVNLSSIKVLIVFLAGGLLANFVYLMDRPSVPSFKQPTEILDKKKTLGLSLIGGSSAIFLGGLPYLAGIFNDLDLAPYVTFYTITRLLLTIQSILTSVRPNLINHLGRSPNIARFVFQFVILIIPIFFLVIVIHRALSNFGLGYLSTISDVELLSFSTSLALTSTYSIYVSSLNASSAWSSGVLPSLSSALLAITLMFSMTDKVTAFHLTMMLAPLTAILLLIHASERSSRTL